MTTQSTVYREKALERISSPEQLDQVMRITPGSAWLVACGAALMLAAVAAWSVAGSLATTVSGTGILLQGGGVDEVVAVGQGQVIALYTDVGDRVERGQLIARIAQPEVEKRIEMQRRRLEELEANRARVLAMDSRTSALRAGALTQQQRTLREAMTTYEDQLRWLRSTYADQLALVEQGLVTRAQLQATQQQIDATLASQREAMVALGSSEVDGARAAMLTERDALESEALVNNAARELALLQETYDQSSRIVATTSGRIAELRVRVGDIVQLGRSLVAIKPDAPAGVGLRALTFVPLNTGKQLAPGQRARIALASVRPEEYGLLEGIVTSVSELPATPDGLRSVLGNDLLMTSILERVGAAPIAVEIELVPHAHTTSGYRWTSKRGPPIQLGAGTPVEVKIAVRQQRPIERAFPFLTTVLGD